jgi:exoribonuclease R
LNNLLIQLKIELIIYALIAYLILRINYCIFTMTVIADKQGKLTLFDGTNYTPLAEEHYDKIYGQNIETKQPIISTFVCVIKFSDKDIFDNTNKTMRKLSKSLIFQFPEIQTKINKEKQKRRIEKKVDTYAIVKIEEIKNGKMYCEVIPQGYMSDSGYLGEVGDHTIESNLMQYVCTAHWKKSNERLQQFIQCKDCDLTPEREDLTKLTVYSIDPPGCKDIDDALHHQYIEKDKQIELGFHIADPSSFFSVESDCDKELRSRVETVYTPNGRIDMIPPELSIEHISLLEKKPKRAFSVILRLDQSNEIVKIEFKKTTISVTQNLSYDQASEMIETNENIQKLYNFGKILKDKISGSFSPDKQYDIHQMVEVYMIYANKFVGEKIQKADPDNVLLRIHAGQHTQMNFDPTNIDPVLIDKNRVSRSEQARYQVGTSNCKHIGLGLLFYTRFTSPIRRYADIMIHRQLWKTINQEQLSRPQTETIFAMNFYNKLFKQMDRYMKIYEVAHTIGSSCKETDAFIVSINDDKETMRIFVPEFNFEYDLSLFDQRLKHIKNVQITDQKITCTDNENNTVVSYSLFQKIQIKMVSSREPFIKLIFEIK